MTCQHCGADLPPIAMFCGECGRSVSARSAVPPVGSRPETPVSVRVGAAPEPEPEPELEPELEPEPEPEPELEAEPKPKEEPSVAPTCSACGTLAQSDDLYCAECGHRLANDTVIIEPLLASPPHPASVEPAPFEPAPFEPVPHEPRSTQGGQFVLRFSTGESYTVLGSGLAGRHPRPEPGEVVDHLVTIVDAGRSVSKTHLEFGQTDGEFWISDRHSGNGTVIHAPGAEPLVCAPGRRYRVDRGTRIDLGEQGLLVT